MFQKLHERIIMLYNVMMCIGWGFVLAMVVLAIISLSIL